MGSGGTYYGRDTTDGYKRNARGYSDKAEELMQRRQVDPGLVFTEERLLYCKARTPIGIAFDGTGSMDTLPKIFCDKMPLIAGQLATRQYALEPRISLAVIGDALVDEAPIQVTDFVEPRHLDEQLQRLWLEGHGGSADARESYEFTLYPYAERTRFRPEAEPILIILGDEGFRRLLSPTDLTRHFGGHYTDALEVETVVERLRQKFGKKIIHLRRQYYDHRENVIIQSMWNELLGHEYVVSLPEDQAVADMVLGILALCGGRTSLDSYLQDMRTARDKPQTEKRISSVGKALESLASVARLMKPRTYIEPNLDPEDRL